MTASITRPFLVLPIVILLAAITTSSSYGSAPNADSTILGQMSVMAQPLAVASSPTLMAAVARIDARWGVSADPGASTLHVLQTSIGHDGDSLYALEPAGPGRTLCVLLSDPAGGVAAACGNKPQTSTGFMCVKRGFGTETVVGCLVADNIRSLAVKVGATPVEASTANNAAAAAFPRSTSALGLTFTRIDGTAITARFGPSHAPS